MVCLIVCVVCLCCLLVDCWLIVDQRLTCFDQFDNPNHQIQSPITNPNPKSNHQSQSPITNHQSPITNPKSQTKQATIDPWSNSNYMYKVRTWASESSYEVT